MMAVHLITKQKWYFIDLCLPFGSSRSCTLFQEFSDAMRHIVSYRISLIIVRPVAISNYLDDFLFMALCQLICDGMVQEFLVVCDLIGCPVSIEKTEAALPWMVFLGILMDGSKKLLVIPFEKKVKALNLLNYALSKKKVTIRFVQQLAGTLNFLNRAMVPGRVFTRGMYHKLKLTKVDAS